MSTAAVGTWSKGDTKEVDSALQELKQFSRTIFTKPLAVPLYLSEDERRVRVSHPATHMNHTPRCLVGSTNVQKSKGLGRGDRPSLVPQSVASFFTSLHCHPIIGITTTNGRGVLASAKLGIATVGEKGPWSIDEPRQFYCTNTRKSMPPLHSSSIHFSSEW
jgi:hypothetical protein